MNPTTSLLSHRLFMLACYPVILIALLCREGQAVRMFGTVKKMNAEWLADFKEPTAMNRREF